MKFNVLNNAYTILDMGEFIMAELLIQLTHWVLGLVQ